MDINKIEQQRMHGIDFARVVLISLGIVIHSAQVFNPTEWLIQCKSPQLFFSYLINIISSFRMHGFYLISGYLSMMMINKYGELKFAYKRLIQLGVPTLFCGLSLNTIASFFVKKNSEGIGYFFDLNYFYNGTWMGHLWFLPNLIAFSILFCVAKVTLSKYTKMSIPKLSFYSVFILLILSELVLGATARFVYRYFHGSTLIFFDIFKLTKYFPFYLLGAYFYKDKHLYEFISKYLSNITIMIITLITLIIDWLGIFTINSIILYIFSFGLALSINGLILYMFIKLFNKENKIIKSLSDSSYSIYVLHQPLIIILGYYTTKLHISNFLNFTFIVITVFIFSYFLHTKLVKNNIFMSFLLNGKTTL